MLWINRSTGTARCCLSLITCHDLVSILDNSFCNMYADDTVIVSSDADINVAVSQSVDLFANINEWCALNKILVNKKKTKQMLIGHKKKG